MAWNTWTEGNVLHAASLNENMSLITAVLHSITGGQMAADAINAGTIIADDVIDETHMNYAATVNAVRCLQIGKDAGTHQQFMCKGTSAITAAAVTNTTITIAYANADLVSDAAAAFLAVPHVYATVYSSLGTDGALNIIGAGTTNCQVNIDLPSTDQFTEAWTVYWMVVGNI